MSIFDLTRSTIDQIQSIKPGDHITVANYITSTGEKYDYVVSVGNSYGELLRSAYNVVKDKSPADCLLECVDKISDRSIPLRLGECEIAKDEVLNSINKSLANEHKHNDNITDASDFGFISNFK